MNRFTHLSILLLSIGLLPAAAHAGCQDPQMPQRKLRATALEETKQLGGGRVEVSSTYYDERYGARPGMPGQGMIRYSCKKEGSCYTDCKATENQVYGEHNKKLEEKAELIDCAQRGNQACREKYMRGVIREDGMLGY